MRRIATWTLLAIYLNASMQAVLPFLSDGVAHIFFWHDHLEHVHHGQVHSHHVANEIAALSDGTDDSHADLPHATFSFDKDALSSHLVTNPLAPLALLPKYVATSTTDRSPHYRSLPARGPFAPPD